MHRRSPIDTTVVTDMGIPGFAGGALFFAAAPLQAERHPFIETVVILSCAAAGLCPASCCQAVGLAAAFVTAKVTITRFFIITITRKRDCLSIYRRVGLVANTTLGIAMTVAVSYRGGIPWLNAW